MASLEIDVTKSMCLRSQQDIYAENRLQSIVTDWKTDDEEHRNRSEQSSLNNSHNDLSVSHQSINGSNNIISVTPQQDLNASHKAKLYLSFPLKRLFALGRGSSSIVYKTMKLTNLKIYAEKVLVVSDPIKKKQIIREIESLRSMFSHNLSARSARSATDRSQLPFTSPFSQNPSPDKSTKLTELTTPKGLHANCQYIVELYDVLQNPLDGTLSLCLEYMNNGSLQDIVNRGGCNHEEILSSFSYQILSGLQFLHELRIVHRDVKPSNILLTLDGRIKLSDFGLAKTMDLGHSLADSFIGTFEYMAPERLAGESYSFSSDIWSFGLSVHTLAIGKFPYDNKKGFWELLHITQQEERPLPSETQFSNDFRQFISLATNRQMDARPSADQLLHHPFVMSKLEAVPNEIWQAFLLELEERSRVRSASKGGDRRLSEKNKHPSFSQQKTNQLTSSSPRISSSRPPLPSSHLVKKESPRSAALDAPSSTKVTSGSQKPGAARANDSTRKKGSNSTPTNRDKLLKENLSSKGDRSMQQFRSNSSHLQQTPSTSHSNNNNSNNHHLSQKTNNNNDNGSISNSSNNSNSTPRQWGSKQHKQISLPSIPSANTATVTRTLQQQHHRPSPRQATTVVNHSAAAVAAQKRNLISNNTQSATAISTHEKEKNRVVVVEDGGPSMNAVSVPRLSLEMANNKKKTKQESPRGREKSSILHTEKALTAADLQMLVNEWGRFVIKYFRYELKRQQQSAVHSNHSAPPSSSSAVGGGASSSFSPDLRKHQFHTNHISHQTTTTTAADTSATPVAPSYDIKSLYITKKVIHHLSQDIHCREEELLPLFQEKIQEIQKELGHIIHYYDRHQPRPYPPNNTNACKMTGKEEKEKEKARNRKEEVSLPRPDRKPSPTIAPSGSGASSTLPYHHSHLTVMIDPSSSAIPTRRRSLKSVTDFDSTLSPSAKSVLSSTLQGLQTLQTMETLAYSAETLDQCIELNSKDWENYSSQTSWKQPQASSLSAEEEKRKEEALITRESQEKKKKEKIQSNQPLSENQSSSSSSSSAQKRESRRSLDSSLTKLPRLSSDNNNSSYSSNHPDQYHLSSRTQDDHHHHPPAFTAAPRPTSNDPLSQGVLLRRSSSLRRLQQQHHQQSSVSSMTAALRVSSNSDEGDRMILRHSVQHPRTMEAREVEEEKGLSAIPSYENTSRDTTEPLPVEEIEESGELQEIYYATNHPTYENSDNKNENEKGKEKSGQEGSLPILTTPQKEMRLSHDTIARERLSLELVNSDDHNKEEDGVEEEDAVLLDMSSILEESILLQQSLANRERTPEEEEGNSDDDDSLSIEVEEDDDEFGEQTIGSVKSFIPSPIMTPHRAQSPELFPNEEGRRGRGGAGGTRGSQDYSMNFDQSFVMISENENESENEKSHGAIAMTTNSAVGTARTIAMIAAAQAPENYENEEFEDFQED